MDKAINSEINDLNQTSMNLFTQGKYQEALVFAQQAGILTGDTLGKHHPEYASSLIYIAMLLQRIGDYENSELYYLQAHKIQKNLFGFINPLNYINCLNYLAWLYEEMGAYQKAEPYYIETLEIQEEVLGTDHPDYATSLNNLAKLYESMGAYDKAQPLYMQAIEIRKKVLGIDHPDYATSLNNLAGVYDSMGFYDRAEPLYLQALEIKRKALGIDHPDYATVLNNLAGLYQMIGDYQKAEPLYEQTLEIRKKTFGIDHPDYTNSLNNLAGLYQMMGDYQKAEPLYEQALEIRKKVVGIDHPDYATSLNNLALFYQMMGAHQKAEPLYEQALEIREKVLGIDHPIYANILNNLAGMHQMMGDYHKAEPLYMQAMEIQEKVLGIDHPDYAISLNNLAGLYDSMGDYHKAEPLYMQAMEIRKEVFGIDHPIYANSLNNLAGLYKSMGDYQKAEPLYMQALEIQKKVLGIDHPDYAISLNNLAGLYQMMGDYQKAEPLCMQALEIQKKVLGIDHPDYAISLNNLALLYDSMGAYDRAESLYIQAGEVLQKTLGKDHSNYRKYLQNLAKLYAATDRLDKAVVMMQEATVIEDRIIGEVFSISSEKQRMDYLSSVRYDVEVFVSFVFQHFAQSPTVVSDALSVILKRKAITLEVLAAQRDAIIGGKYPHLRDKLHQLNTLRMQIASKEHAYTGKEGLEAHHRTLSKWSSEKEHIEAELSRQIPEMRLEQILKNANRTLIAKNLPPESVLLEFFRYNEFDFKSVPAKGDRRWKPALYCAFVMPSGQSDNVTLIDLGEADKIDRLITLYKSKLIVGGQVSSGIEILDQSANTRPGIHSQLSGEKGIEGDQRSRLVRVIISDQPQSGMGVDEGLQLYSSLLAPLKDTIGNCRHLVIAPDSQLSMIPFEVIPTPEGGYLVDQYHISYVGVGRDVLRFSAQISLRPEKAMVIASPDFDLSAEENLRQSEYSPDTGRHSRDFPGNIREFPSLPGTKLEGEYIGTRLGIKPLLEQDALESRLKSVSSPHILHIATHGFFLKDQEIPANRTGIGFGSLGNMNMQRLSGAGIENPMLRSGLVLAGVNTWMKNGELPPEAEDGVLTAEDVTALDLTNTNLVVLSACETGLGDVKIGEGVFGLRRAFTLAGAKTLVMSLWKVSDVCTAELMEDFYRRILAGTPKAEALRETQIKLRERYPHPRDWGAFICQGDPGPLSVNKG